MKKFNLITLLIVLIIGLQFEHTNAQSINTGYDNSGSKLRLTNSRLMSSYADQNSLNKLGSGNNFGLVNATDNNNNVRVQLSTLWTVVSLEIIVADVLSLYVPESNKEFTELANGKEAELMLAGAATFVIPISMVYLSRVLPYEANRITNIVASGLTTAWVLAGGSWNEPLYYVCAGVEVAALSLIAWKAIKWKNPADKKHDFAMNISPSKKAYGFRYSYRF